MRQISSGGVVFKRAPLGVQVCLIARRRFQELVWCLPKGHVEPNESFEEAALREVKEETGISARILAPLGPIRYSFFDLEERKRILKTVHFFLMRYSKGKLTDHDDEVECAKWFLLGEALQNAEYPSEKEILKSAIRKLKALK
ncbi:MAG: NUDIX hydrolase [Candidatus Omnitrophica bacterium]|nr:NUDIX hydrolase [Candidatus Omnitrophota bacterium]